MLAHGVESTTELICITDLNDRFVFTNPAFRKAFGYAAHEIIGKTPELIFSPNNPPRLLNQILPFYRVRYVGCHLLEGSYKVARSIYNTDYANGGC